MCLTISSIYSSSAKLYALAVSMAIGKKKCVAVRFEYLAILIAVALIAVALIAASSASVDILHIWDSAKMSMMVTSHARSLPLAHGINMMPSGRLPSVRIRPTGSLAASVLAHRIDLQIRWLICECPCFLTALFLQERP